LQEGGSFFLNSASSLNSVTSKPQDQ